MLIGVQKITRLIFKGADKETCQRGCRKGNLRMSREDDGRDLQPAQIQGDHITADLRNLREWLNKSERSFVEVKDGVKKCIDGNKGDFIKPVLIDIGFRPGVSLT